MQIVNGGQTTASILNASDNIYRKGHKHEGKKIDIRCDCCDFVDSLPNNFENIKKEKCFGKKSAYMIEKVVDEIVLAKAKRESDGTYSA